MFSYTEYINILNIVRDNLPIIDFSLVKDDTKSFCVVRHDVEFSIERAHKLAVLENNIGINSTFTVQLRNNTYNALSEKNIKLVKDIYSMGHRIGLHQNPPQLGLQAIKDNILKDIDVLEHYYGFEIDRFAFHRPNLNPTILGMYVEVPGLINCNGPKYFHYYTGNKPKNLNVTYLADSNHQWKYGHPIELDFSKVEKLQINTHPFSWTETGFETHGNFLSLIEERKREMLYDMESENKAFPKELLF